VSGGVAGTGGGAAPAPGGTGASGAMIETQSQADFWKELQATLTAIVGGEGGRKVIVNPQAGIVVVRAYPEELRVVEDYLGDAHASVQRQVVIEAKILDVELRDGFQTGINWAAISRSDSGSVLVGQVGGGTSLSPSGLSEIAGNTGNLNPDAFAPISGTDASAFGGVFTVAAKFRDFAAFLELLQTQGEVQVLSSPRVSTLNNQKAVIKVGTDEFFVTKQEITQSTTAGVAPTVTTELSPFFSGIALDVTPQIDEAGNINLHIHPSVSSVTDKFIVTSTISGTGGTSASQQLQTARSKVQESDNIVRAQSGQIIVIGGLMSEASTDQDATVPLLGDIPLLGYLFKHKKVARIKKELVILLKPTVVTTGQDFDDAVRESQDRIKKIKLGS
jgi:MSHA biogenesis protein MshL